MEPILKNVELISKKEIAKNLFDFTVKDAQMAKLSIPGQFLHIKCSDKFSLRRPISICDVNDDEIRFIFEIRGEGTLELSKFCEGDLIDILGPLGNGFPDRDINEKAVFVGGGIGIFPLLYKAREYGQNATVILGFRDKDNAVLIDDFKRAHCNVFIATDNGSLGHNGFVTDILQSSTEKFDVLYACGPLPMLKKCAVYCKDTGTEGFLSLEERMGCGIGACLVCACKIATETGSEFRHVCKDGPIFSSKEVMFFE